MARRQSSVTEWAQRVSSLRRHHGFSQMELGRRLRCSAMTVSRWERGMLEPSAESYIQLGNLSCEPDCWYFWGRAGLQSSDLMRVLPDTQSQRVRTTAFPNLDIVVAGTGNKKDNPKGGRLIAVPLPKIHSRKHWETGEQGTELKTIPRG